MRGGFGHGGDDGDGGGAAADDHDAFARVIERPRPVLRMDDAAAEVLHAGPAGRVAVDVVVVAGADEEKVAGELDRLSFRPRSASTVHCASAEDHDAR